MTDFELSEINAVLVAFEGRCISWTCSFHLSKTVRGQLNTTGLLRSDPDFSTAVMRILDSLVMADSHHQIEDTFHAFVALYPSRRYTAFFDYLWYDAVVAPRPCIFH